jgi:WD40 repeat protein
MMKRRKAPALLSLVALLLSGATHAYAEPTTVLRWVGHRMFEDFSARSEVSPDGRYVLRTFIDGNQALLQLPSGSSEDALLDGPVKNFEQAAWCGAGLLRLGTLNGGRHWFVGDRTPRAVDVPAGASPTCDRSGSEVAYFWVDPARLEAAPAKAVFIGTLTTQKQVDLEGVPLAVRFSPDGTTLYVLARQDDGASLLAAIAVKTYATRVLARNLDAWPFPGPELTVTDDGAALILPLGGLSPPNNAVRQVPHEPGRWLKLYRFDLRAGGFTLLRARPFSDQTDPTVVGNDLYWVSTHTTKRVALLPTGGGRPRVLLPGQDGYLPSWNLDGTRLTFVTGDFRLVDWGLPQDDYIVRINHQGMSIGTAKPFIVGNDEDFPPVWSPDGKWIAWHSHRDSKEDPAYYGAPGTTDDIWIRPADAPPTAGVRVTNDLWETGWVYWSPDGRQLIYTTWDRNGQPGIYQVRTTTIDPATGRPLGEHRFPMPSQVQSAEIAKWSPQGKEIAVEDAVSPTERVLWIVSDDGRHLTKLATYHSETYGGLDWTPDGKTLIFAGLVGDRMQIFSVPRAGGPVRRLSVGNENYLNPRISPDGRWIACSVLSTVQSLVKESP